jgi:hypothetical protein
VCFAEMQQLAGSCLDSDCLEKRRRLHRVSLRWLWTSSSHISLNVQETRSSGHVQERNTVISSHLRFGEDQGALRSRGQK